MQEYYSRDAAASAVNQETLKAILSDSTRNDKHVQTFHELVDQASELDISDVNVRHVVLGAKKQELALALARAIAEGKDHDELLAEYSEILTITDLKEGDKNDVVLVGKESLRSIMEIEKSGAGKMMVYPKSISDRIGGGVSGGHHIVVFAMSEAGKTALMLTVVAGMVQQGYKGVYFGNEDRTADMLLRLVSCLTGLDKESILANPDEAIKLAEQRGLDLVQFAEISPGTPAQIERVVEEEEPAWIVIDQLRNMAMKSDNRVVQLEAAATAARNIAKKHNVAVFSVTQAGESARDKLVLDTGDVDFSNVGIPAQADLMIGIGINAKLDNEGMRMISLPKNKLSGDHSHFLVKINPRLSRYSST